MGNHSMNDVESQATEGGGSPAFTFNDGSLALSGDWTALREQPPPGGPG